MFQNLDRMLELCSTHFWLARVPVAAQRAVPINPPLEAAPSFPVPQFLVALFAGVLMAFAFQFLLTNFTIAAGISSGENPLEAEAAETLGGKISEVESKVGFWALVTVNIAIFTACFLAVKLTLMNSVSLGAITSVVIWSVFFLLLLWLSSRAIGSLAGSIVDTASSGMQGVMAIAATALGGQTVNTQVVNTVQESVAAVRRELSSAIDPSTVQETVQDYLGNLKPSQLDLQGVRKNFLNLLNNSDLSSVAGSDLLNNINRQTFVDLASSRTDLSKEEINRIADQLESAWQQVVGQQQPKELQQQLLNLFGRLTETNQNQSSSGLGQRSLQLGLSTLLGTVLNKAVLSDLDMEKMGSQLQKLIEQSTEQAKKVGSQVAEQTPSPFNNVIKADVEDYLLNSKPWHLNRETLKQEFKEVIYDPEAAPGLVRQQLEQLNRDNFVKILNQRNGFAPEQVNEIADSLEDIRKEVLAQVQSAGAGEQSQDLRTRLENYLRSTSKEELNPEGIKSDFQTLLNDPEAGFAELSDRFSQFDRDTLVQMLTEAREDLSEEEEGQIVNQLESTRDRVLSEAQELQEQAQSQAEELGQKIESYLRDTNKEELDPEGIKQDLQTLRDRPREGVSALRERLSKFDRDTLVKLLTERGDLSEDEINQFIDRFSTVRDNILRAPQELADKAKGQYEQITSKIADYLRSTNLEELDPEGIKQDLQKLLDDPRQGAGALRERLSEVDRETLVKLLSQREDLSEEQVNQSIDRVQEAIGSIVRAPRRLASRAQEQIQDWQSSFEDYLRNTNKEELNPEGIKRDLQTLLDDPQAGWENVSDRLSHIDRDTIVSLLSQREDISEEEANQIVEQIESVRERMVEQVQAVQQKAQAAVESVFDRTKNYLNSLERPELNYEGIEQDIRKLFDAPEAGFEALSDRLSQFDRDTLVALLSSREDISEAEANRIVDRITGVRDRVLNRAQRLQEATQERVEKIQQNAAQQLASTRKAAATAAWWLFGTALTSVGVAAFAGFLAVRGLALFD